MADKPTSSRTGALGTPLLTKQDLVDCFATREFAMPVVAAVNPHIDEIKAEINATKRLIHSQQHELTRLRGAVIAHEQQLRIQAEEIKKLKAKQDTEERNEKQKILVVNGLEKENPTDHFIKIVKENLDIELKTQNSPSQQKNSGNGRRKTRPTEETNQLPATRAKLRWTLKLLWLWISQVFGKKGKCIRAGQGCVAPISSCQRTLVPVSAPCFSNAANWDAAKKKSKAHGPKTWQFSFAITMTKKLK